VLFVAYTGDGLRRMQLSSKFYTYDQDVREYKENKETCAAKYRGAWWYGGPGRGCHQSNLNGLYLRGRNNLFAKGVIWSSWAGNYYSLRFTEMKIKSY